MTADVGVECAQASITALMVDVYAKYKPADRAELHEAILAERALKAREAQLLTQWAELVRAGEVAEHGSERKAAEALGVARRTVRPRRAKT